MRNYKTRAGKSTRDMAEKRYKSRIWFVLLIAGIAILIVIMIFNANLLGISGLGIIGLALLARFVMDYGDSRVRRIEKEEMRAIRGAKAEERIGLLVDDLGEDFLVMHDVESPYGNIDHIIISKESGVFLIETKAHGGRVSATNGRLYVNGNEPEKDFVAQVLKNTYWLRDEIRNVINVKIWITPILVFTNAFVERTIPIKGVAIINKKYLLNILYRKNVNSRNLKVWENRRIIQEALS